MHQRTRGPLIRVLLGATTTGFPCRHDPDTIPAYFSSTTMRDVAVTVPTVTFTK